MLRRVMAAGTLVAVTATVGSLYFSEIAELTPCELCWYQRILMYPLVVVLGVAAYENHTAIWRSCLPLSGLGIVIAAYHSYLQIAPGTTSTCSVGGGCGGILWQGFGIFTIPRLSLLAFFLITIGLGFIALRDRMRDS